MQNLKIFYSFPICLILYKMKKKFAETKLNDIFNFPLHYILSLFKMKSIHSYCAYWKISKTVLTLTFPTYRRGLEVDS